MTAIAIIGAGLAGLTLARRLQDRAKITVFEKSRGVGGRMSTRWAEPYAFDHGAQYFTVRTTAFQSFIQPYIQAGHVARWSARYAQFEGKRIVKHHSWDDDEPRYVGAPGMNSLAKELAKDTTVKFNTKITSLQQNQGWQLNTDAGTFATRYDWVIITAPAPQAVQLLPKTFAFYADVDAVAMQACFSVMLGFSQPLALDFEAAHVKHADISWLAVNSHKPQRATRFTLMVHSAAEYAERHIDTAYDDVLQHLCCVTSDILGHDVDAAEHKAIHSWRYASNATAVNAPVLIDPHLQLAACGDWCVGGRVEGAFTAADQLAQTLETLL